jgi:copper homeostasis protein
MGEPPLLEVCVDSPAGLLAAVGSGAGRIELCAALALSGLTPSPGLMALAARQPCPSFAMIRPRPGDFVYSPAEVDVMRADIDAARGAGLAGVVLGASRPSGELDEEVLSRLVEHAAGLGLTLHRAFDLVPDFKIALERAVALGLQRVLTSGGEPTAVLGGARIADLVVQARGRIAIMAGSGLDAGNVADLVRRTGVREVHASCGAPPPSPGSERAQALGFVSSQLRDTRAESVSAMVQALEGL